MTDALDILDERLGLLAEEWAEALPPMSCGDGTRVAASRMSDAGLIRVVSRLAALQGALDAARVAVAGEVVHRSTFPAVGVEGLARELGHRTPVDLLTRAWGVTAAEAARLCQVGERTRPTLEGPFAGDAPSFPAVAEAVDAGVLPVAAASAILRRMLEAAPRCVRADRDAAERGLVEVASAFTAAEVDVLACQVRDRIDADGPPPSERQRRERRSWRMSTRPLGITRVVWDMPAETAGLVKAGIDAVVAEQLRRDRETHGGIRFEPDALPRHTAAECPDLARCDELHRDVLDDALDDALDLRTLPQLRSDAAEQVFRHAATCDAPGGDLPAVQLVVRIDYDHLVDGLGFAHIDGIEHELPADAARRLAGEAGIIPLVLAGDGQVLDEGRSRRLFSPAQKLALAERDDGCAAGGCTAPPAYTEAHHIRWWSEGGATDLDNGVLLCSFHHHRVHDGGWIIEVRDGVPWFAPPPGIPGPPRRGGRLRPEHAGAPPRPSPRTAWRRHPTVGPPVRRRRWYDSEQYIPDELVV